MSSLRAFVCIFGTIALWRKEAQESGESGERKQVGWRRLDWNSGRGCVPAVAPHPEAGRGGGDASPARTLRREEKGRPGPNLISVGGAIR